MKYLVIKENGSEFTALKLGVGVQVLTSPNRARVFEGDQAPTPEEMQAIFALPAAPATARELSKLTLRRRLRALGKEEAFDAALDAIPHARADWVDAQSLRTDDALFTSSAPALKAALGLTDEQFAELIA